MNENGQRLLELCSYRKLCISNTFLNTKPHHRVSWRHLRSRHWHQLNLIISVSVLATRSFHSADCDTDHTLVYSKVRLLPRKIHHQSKQKRPPRINIAKTSDPGLSAQFAGSVETALEEQPEASTAEERWNFLRDKIHSAALSTFVRRSDKTQIGLRKVSQ